MCCEAVTTQRQRPRAEDAADAEVKKRLSRRDRVKIAWHEMPGIMPPPRPLRPLREAFCGYPGTANSLDAASGRRFLIRIREFLPLVSYFSLRAAGSTSGPASEKPPFCCK